jgi:hypothetical protein
VLSNRWIVNVALIVLIAVLFFIAMNFEQQPSQAQAARISGLALDDIDSIEVDSGDVQLRLSRLDDSWSIDQPVNWPAHSTNVNRLLSIINSKAEMLAHAADVDLGALGLEQPVARLRLNDADLLFGARNNIGERRYLMIDSSIYLLADVHLAFLTQGLPGFVDRQLLPKRYRVESIKLPEIEIQRDADEQWRTLPPGDYSQAQLQQLVDNWQQLQASRIKPFDLGGLARQLVEVRLEDGRSIEFVLLSSTNELIIANSQIGMQYHFLRDYEDQLMAIGEAASAN